MGLKKFFKQFVLPDVRSCNKCRINFLKCMLQLDFAVKFLGNVQNMKSVQTAQISYFVHFLNCTDFLFYTFPKLHRFHILYISQIAQISYCVHFTQMYTFNCPIKQVKRRQQSPLGLLTQTHRRASLQGDGVDQRRKTLLTLKR